jgi:hypothetical protein
MTWELIPVEELRTGARVRLSAELVLVVKYISPAYRRGRQVGWYVHWTDRNYQHLTLRPRTPVAVVCKD